MIKEIKPTYNRRSDNFDNFIDYHVEETGGTKVNEFRSLQEEFTLQARVSVKFWANPAQYDSAVKIAEKTLNAKLYGDIYQELHNARLAISNGDRSAAFNAINKIQDILENKV